MLDEKIYIIDSKSKTLVLTLLIISLIIIGISVYTVYDCHKDIIYTNSNVVAETSTILD